MKLTKFLKTIVISVLLSVCVVAAGFAFVGCSMDNSDNDYLLDKNEEREMGLVAAMDFFTKVKDGGNYHAVSKYRDGTIYEFFLDGDKIKVEYNGTFYGVKEDDRFYKITQVDDMTWHKTDDISELRNSEEVLTKLINNIHATPWSSYDRKTKTLTWNADDGTLTLKLSENEAVYLCKFDDGTTTSHTYNAIGTTTVTLPENIIDDTQEYIMTMACGQAPCPRDSSRRSFHSLFRTTKYGYRDTLFCHSERSEESR